MSYARTLALSVSLLCAAGCGGGGGSSSATPGGPPGPVATPTPTPSPAASLFPSASSAATHMLSNVSTSQTVHPGADHQDDGGWSELQLPTLQQCGNGAFATDCTVWSFTGRAGSGASRSPQSARFPRTPIVGSRPPTLNFCRDAAAYPGDLGTPAIPVSNLSGTIFALTYTGSKSLPIVTFATRWWMVNVTNSFAANASSASAIGVTPVGGDTPARGYVMFFTWSWPADVLLIPFAVDEIQLAASSSPLAIPANSSATLGAFDCLGRPITATSSFGSGFGFAPDLTSPAAAGTSSTGPELNVPVYTGAAPSGPAVLYDDRGAASLTPVT